MLSLSPRYDLFRFTLPKDFLSDDITEKYQKIISKDANTILTPIDYLNESIQKVSIPGISDILGSQDQHGSNSIQRTGPSTSSNRLGRINVEPRHEVTYMSATNPLDKIEKDFKVTFRMNQGMYNYYMLYETIFNHYCKHKNMPCFDVLYIEMMDENGVVTGRIKYKDCYINSIDGLEYSYDKTTRDTGTFDITFRFNNIDFEFLP